MGRALGEDDVCLTGAFEQQAQHSSWPLVGLGRELRRRDQPRDVGEPRNLSTSRQCAADLVNRYPGTVALGQVRPWSGGSRQKALGPRDLNEQVRHSGTKGSPATRGALQF